MQEGGVFMLCDIIWYPGMGVCGTIWCVVWGGVHRT